MIGEYRAPLADRPAPGCNAIAKRWAAELRRKQHLSPEGQQAARLKAKGKRIYKEMRGMRRRA